MIKKIMLISIFCTLVFSCGKKSDPEYKETKSNTFIKRV